MSNLKFVSTILYKEKKHVHKLGKVYLRNSSNYKRPPLPALSQTQFEELRTNYFLNRTELTATQWQEARTNLLSNYKYINKSNVDAVILSACSDSNQLNLAKDYVRFLRDNAMEPNLATLGKLLRLYNGAYKSKLQMGETLTKEEQQDIWNICNDITNKYELLDVTSCDNLIHGLVATEQWTKAKDILNMMRITSNPTLAAYTELAAKAFHMGDLDYGWRLLEEMLIDRKQPKCEIFIEYLNYISNNSKDLINDFEKLLRFLENHELLISEKVIERIQQFSKDYAKQLAITNTTLNKVGKCNSCGKFMDIVAVSDKEFAILREAFLNKVLIRKDVFQKSTPDEVERFQKYVDKTSPYDCVIDGLNVAYSTGAKKPPQVFANLLATVVKHFHVRNKHVLVIGRKHMNSWPKDIMHYIRKHASVFLTNNLSHDDPFLLYATIKSGPLTDFFSRDLMRTHAYLLGPELRTTFRRWQQEHQYSLITQKQNGTLIIKEPIRHLVHAHKIQNTWHLPYQKEYQVNSSDLYEVPERWLCINIQNTN